MKSFDRLGTNGNRLIPFVASVSNHEWNPLVRSFHKYSGEPEKFDRIESGHRLPTPPGFAPVAKPSGWPTAKAATVCRAMTTLL